MEATFLRYSSMLKVGRTCTSAGALWAPVSKHIMSRYGVLPWLWPPSKAWLVDPMIGISRHVKDLTSPQPHVMQQHLQVGGPGGLRTPRIQTSDLPRCCHTQNRADCAGGSSLKCLGPAPSGSNFFLVPTSPELLSQPQNQRSVQRSRREGSGACSA